jgi:hypothetical protein
MRVTNQDWIITYNKRKEEHYYREDHQQQFITIIKNGFCTAADNLKLSTAVYN